MLVPGTQMYWVTFGFICIELVILLYLIIYRLARVNDRATSLNIVLIILLIVYNITGGLLPDPNLPGSFFIQESIAYGTGFITPCYFPYYVYKGFGISPMKFHAHRGVFYFLLLPYVLFVIVFAFTDDLEHAQNILIIPVVYALWVMWTLAKAVRYRNDLSRPETSGLFISLAPWVGLPVITYFDMTQGVEVTMTNTGFLLLLALHLKRNVTQLRIEHERLIASEQQLLSWNETLQAEVDKRTQQIERMSKEERFNESAERFALTKREKEIARLVCAGQTHKQIGETLFIAERTVAKHVQNIFERVSVNNKMELCQKMGV